MLTFRCLQTWMCFILLVYLLLHNFDSLFSLFSFLSSLFSSLFNFIPFSLYSSQHQHHLEHSYSFLSLDLFSPWFRMSLICQLNFCFCNLNSCSLLSDFFFCTFHNTLLYFTFYICTDFMSIKNNFLATFNTVQTAWLSKLI